MDIKDYLENVDRIHDYIGMYRETLDQLILERKRFDQITRNYRSESQNRLVVSFHSINDDLRERISGHIDSAQEKIDQVNSMVEQLQDEEIRDMLREHYIEGQSQAAIAENHFYCMKSVQKRINKGLSQLQIMLDSMPAQIN